MQTDPSQLVSRKWLKTKKKQKNKVASDNESKWKLLTCIYDSVVVQSVR